jgi:hypothetical protein
LLPFQAQHGTEAGRLGPIETALRGRELRSLVRCLQSAHPDGEEKAVTMITINVQNNGPATQNFFYCMSPVSCSTGAQSYCNSLGTASLGNYAQTGTIVSFVVDFQYQAGVQQAYSPPVAGQESGFYSSSQAIALSDGGCTLADATTMKLNPLSLSPALPGSMVPNGTFRITTPVYDSSVLIFNAGTALRTTAGGVVLPSFVMASPGMNIDVQPARIFYVGVGKFATGVVVVMNSTAGMAKCDATGYTSFLVTYSASGTFSVVGFVDMSAVSRKAMTGSAANAQAVINQSKHIVVPL